MKVLLAWLGAACCVPVGSILGSRGVAVAPSLVVASLTGAAIVAVLATIGRRQRALLVCAYAVLLARGVDASSRPTPQWTEAARGVVLPVRTFETVGPSTPGARCRVSARPDGADVVVELSLPAQICPVGAGERWWVPTAIVAGAPPTAARAAAIVVPAHFAYRAAPVPTDARGRSSRALARLRQTGWEARRGDDGVAFVAAAVMGLRRGLSPRARESLRAAGLGHLVAISGLHVALVGWWVLRLGMRAAAWAGLRPWLGVLPSVLAIVGYVGIAGAPASAVRAAVMAAIVGLGLARRQPTHGLTALAVAVTVMLAAVPGWVTDPGFHLSVSAMAAVVTAPAGASTWRVTWRVTWAVAPAAILHFGMASPWGCLANLVAIPIATIWVMPLGMLGALVLPWFPAAWGPAAIGADAILDLAALVDRLPRLGPAGWGALGLSLVGGRVALTRSRRGGVPVWLYAITACAAAVGPPPSVVAPRWVAFGGGPRPTVLTFATDDRSRRACVQDAPGSPGAVLRVMDRIGIDTLGAVTPDDDPAGRALVALARRRGVTITHDACPAAPAEVVRATLRRCGRDDRRRPTAAADQRGDVRCVRTSTWSLLDFGGFRR